MLPRIGPGAIQVRTRIGQSGIFTPLNPLDLVKLSILMKMATSKIEIVVGLIDGPVCRNRPDLALR